MVLLCNLERTGWLAALTWVDRARALAGEALEINRAQVPESADHAFSLERLARIAELDGDLAGAETELEHALAIRQRLDGGSVDSARTLARIAELARQRGDLEVADRAAKDAQSRLEQRASGAPAHGGTLHVRAEIARDRAQHAEALRLFRQAIAILERVVPDTLAVAQVHHGLARSLRALGDSGGTLERYEQALQVFERQVRKVGDALDRARFADRFERTVQDYVDLLIELGFQERAFSVLERMRARQARVQLESHDTKLMGQTGPLGRHSEEYRVLAVEYDRLLERLLTADSAASAAEIDALRSELIEVDRRRRATLTEMVEIEPRLALLDPPVVDLVTLSQFLGSDTLLLSYLLGEEHGWLFALHGGSVTSHRLASASELDQLIERFRALAASPGPVGSQKALFELGSRLYSMLVAPVGAVVLDRAARIVVVPDRALHRLPFAALVTDLVEQPPPAGARGAPSVRFLLERAPIHYASSASTEVALARRRRVARNRSRAPSPEPRLAIAAFGDPRYQPESLRASQPHSPEAQQILRAAPAQLPWSRREVRALASLFDDTAVFLGSDATELQARTVAGRANVLHFAVHGFSDSRIDADSGLLFTPAASGPRARTATTACSRLGRSSKD